MLYNSWYGNSTATFFLLSMTTKSKSSYYIPPSYTPQEERIGSLETSQYHTLQNDEGMKCI